MKKWIFGVFFLSVLIAIRVFFFPDKKSPDSKSKEKKRSAVAVKIKLVRPENLDEVYFSSGSLLADERISLTPEISSRIKAIYFKEGESVSAGDVLVKLNDSELQAAKRKAMAQLSICENKVKRLKEVLPLNGISKEEFELAQTSEELAKAELQIINAQIDKTEIRAPFSGIVGVRNLSEGSIVDSKTIIASLQKIDFLKLDFALPEKYADLIKKDDKVFFQANTNAGKIDAIVIAVDPSVDADTRTIWVRAKVNNKAKKLLAGQFVKVEIPLAKKDNAIFIPSEAVISDMKGKKVYVVKNGKAESRVIKPGLRSESKLEVLEGIQEGDSLIISGLSNLRENSEVKPVKE